MPQTTTYRTKKIDAVSGEPFIEVLTEVKVKDAETGLWSVDKSQTKVERLSIESQGEYFRELTTSVVIVRKATMSDMIEHTGFFQQRILAKVDTSQNDYKHTYLKRGMYTHSLMVENFDSIYGNVQPIALNDSRFVTCVGKAKRISESEAKRLLISHEAIALVEETKDPENPAKTIWRVNV